MKKINLEKIKQLKKEHPERFLSKNCIDDLYPDDLYYNILVQVLRKRIKNELSQEDMAIKLGLYIQDYEMFEDYEKELSINELQKIADVLNCNWKIELVPKKEE